MEIDCARGKHLFRHRLVHALVNILIHALLEQVSLAHNRHFHLLLFSAVRYRGVLKAHIIVKLI